METININIKGMTCASCVGRVEKALRKNPGVKEAAVNLATEKAKVTFDPNATNLEEILALVEKAGYKATPEQQKRNREKELQEEKKHVLYALILSLPLVLAMFFNFRLSPWIQLALATPIQFWLGTRFYRQGWSALKVRSGNMELLIAIGSCAAFLLCLFLLT